MSSETIQMMQKAFGNECMSKTRIKEWYNRFKGGRTSVDSDSRSGRPSTTKTLDIERVRLAIEQDRRMTVWELEEDLGIPKTIIWEILTSNLQMTRVGAKFIPKMLNAEQKKNVKIGAVWSQCWLFFFHYEGVVNHEYAPTGQTNNEEYYVQILKRVCEAVRRNRPHFWSSGDLLLQHDNAPAHSSNLVQQFLSKHSIAWLRHHHVRVDQKHIMSRGRLVAARRGND